LESGAIGKGRKEQTETNVYLDFGGVGRLLQEVIFGNTEAEDL
jgi:hypothetical protein